MNSVLGAQPPPLLPPPLRDGRERRCGEELPVPPVPLQGRFPVAILQAIFLKEGLSAQADRRPEALSPDFNRQEA